MKTIIAIDTSHYGAQIYSNLISERIGKTPFVRVRRQWGDLPFYKYYLLRWCGEIARYFQRIVNVIEYEIRVTEGMEKDVVWRKRDDGLYEPYDKFADVTMPHLARSKPPKRKRIVKGRVVEVRGG